jgi:hypothetical protein
VTLDPRISTPIVSEITGVVVVTRATTAHRTAATASAATSSWPIVLLRVLKKHVRP